MWLIPNPTHLWLADKLTPLADVEKTLGIKWTEMILGEMPIYNAESKLPEISQSDYLAHLKELQENCAIRWLDNELGWVLTLRAGKTLSKGFKCCYTGAVTKNLLKQESSYSTREYFFSLSKTAKEDIGIDARSCGNMARLLPFLLEAEHLDNFIIDPTIKDRIAVANLQFKLVVINGTKAPCVYAPANIIAPPNQELLLGINYSLPYLYKMYQAKKVFKLLDKNTFKPLNPQHYPQKIIQVNLEGLPVSFAIPRLRIMAVKYLPQLKQKTMAYDDVKQGYYEIIIADKDMYEALLQSPNTETITIKPIIKKPS